jgi:antirestriction protein ArdC
MGGAYLCAEAGISNAVIENQAADLAGWLKRFCDDRRLLILAATQAQHEPITFLAEKVLRAEFFAALARCASAVCLLPNSLWDQVAA